MSQRIEFATCKLRSIAAAGLTLLAALLAAPAAATQPATVGGGASTIGDPSSRCDLKSPATNSSGNPTRDRWRLAGAVLVQLAPSTPRVCSSSRSGSR